MGAAAGGPSEARSPAHSVAAAARSRSGAPPEEEGCVEQPQTHSVASNAPRRAISRLTRRIGPHSARETDYAHREHFAAMTELSRASVRDRALFGGSGVARSSIGARSSRERG